MPKSIPEDSYNKRNTSFLASYLKKNLHLIKKNVDLER